jgi:4-amino-4-deoxy-L-arabinose transferase
LPDAIHRPVSRKRAISRTLIGALLLTLLLVLGLAFQGHRAVFETTEGRYTSVASEMLRLQDWLVPHLNEEQPHFTKPPLTYWLLAASIHTFGRNELAVRLPGALAFILAALFVARAGCVLTPRYPLLPAVIYATFLFPASASNVISTDNFLTLAEVAAMIAFAEHYFGPGRRPLLSATAGWAFFGLAFLTKGYPALLPLLALGAFHCLRGRHMPGKRLFTIPGTLLFAALGTGWFIVVIRRDPALLQYFIGNELLGRVAGVHDRNPEWYRSITVYGPVVLLGTIPWTLSAARAVRESFHFLCRSRKVDSTLRRDDHDVVLYLAVWLILPTLVFMLVKSRLQLYLLPQFAPLAILTAQSLSRTTLNMHSVALKAGVSVAMILSLRMAAAEVYSNHDSRFVARQIAALPGYLPREVIFVDAAPYRGVAFYLGIEVEQVSLSVTSAKRLGVETVDQELEDDETDRLWLVPVPLADRFRALATVRGVRELAILGEIVTDQPEVALMLRRRQRHARADESPSGIATTYREGFHGTLSLTNNPG